MEDRLAKDRKIKATRENAELRRNRLVCSMSVAAINHAGATVFLAENLAAPLRNSAQRFIAKN
eukprot:274364-Alexandrium_andersonii.AAC.1